MGTSSAVDDQKTDFVLVLDSIALTVSHRRNPLVITAAMPVPARTLVAAGLGRRRLASPLLDRGRVLARVEIVHAGAVLTTEESPPQGPMLRESVRDLVMANRLFKGVASELEVRLERHGLQAGLDGHEPPPPGPDWLLTRLEDLGLEEPEDLSLLGPEDLLPEVLPDWKLEALDREYPRSLDIGDAHYRISYDPTRRIAIVQPRMSIS